MKIISVVGARPNFMKVAPLVREFKKHENIKHILVHTGQHYDEKMSKVFFEDLELPEPDYYLGVGSGSHAYQTAKVMLEFEPILVKENPDLVIVVGDVNSTLACALTAKKLHIKVAHIESGLRSFDREMPEEINRIVVDSISDLLFTTELSAILNLRSEGVRPDKIHNVGNTMIDSLVYYSDNFRKFGSRYVIATLHRPSNVDIIENLRDILKFLNTAAEMKPVKFVVHPRTKEKIEKYLPDFKFNKNLELTDPMGYIHFMSYLYASPLVITDSGGLQEETSFLNIPCITLRTSTERPITIEKGTNYLCPSLDSAMEKVIDILNGRRKQKKEIPYWDGKASERITEILMTNFSKDYIVFNN